MASSERKIEELRSQQADALNTALQDPQQQNLDANFDKWREENPASWDVVLDGFESGKYSNMREFRATQLLNEIGEKNFPDAEKLINQLMITVGNKYVDLRNQLADLKARIDLRGKLAQMEALLDRTVSPNGPSPSGSRKPEDEEEVQPERPSIHQKMVLDLPSTPGEDIWTARRR